MRRILFVDDEQVLLDGLRRMLYDLSGHWVMEFVTSAQDGLRAMEHEPFDVVVSDMRMPGLDGADFLAEVRKRYPKTARIILSGQSDETAILRAVGATHQYLSKPCDPDLLRRTVERVCALQDLLECDRVRSFVAEIQSLPSVPSLYQEITKLSRDPRATLESLGQVIERDVAMSATVLKLVNSAYFGMARPVESVTRAVMFLGLDTIRALVLGSGVFQEYRGLPPEILSVEELWDHSVRTSAFARAIAKSESVAPEVINQAGLAAMFHDVGKLILVTHDAEKYRKVRERIAREPRRHSEIELEVYHATHAEIGAYLLGLWGFPDDVVRAVAFHARPLGSWDDAGGATTWVHVADALARAAGGPKDLATSHVDVEYLRAHGWADKLPQWTELCASLMPGAAQRG
ncbi:MAG: response regulator [bacterium]